MVAHRIPLRFGGRRQLAALALVAAFALVLVLTIGPTWCEASHAAGGPLSRDRALRVLTDPNATYDQALAAGKVVYGSLRRDGAAMMDAARRHPELLKHFDAWIERFPELVRTHPRKPR